MDFETIELRNLWAAGVKKEQIAGLDIIVLPENLDTQKKDLYDSQDAITLSKLLKAEGVKCANSYDLGLDLPTKERRSDDIWLGQLYILNDFVIPTLTGVVGSLLANLISVWKKRKDSREPAGKVHADITIIRPEGKTDIRYSGEPEALIKIIKALQKDQHGSKDSQ